MGLGSVGGKTKPAQSIRAQTIASATTTNGVAVDCTGYDEVTWEFDAGTHVGAGCTSTVTIEESATSGGSYAAIPGAAFVAVTAANDDAIYEGVVRVNPAKPFQRAVNVTSGTVTAAPVSVSARLSKSHLPAGDTKGPAAPAFQVTAV